MQDPQHLRRKNEGPVDDLLAPKFSARFCVGLCREAFLHDDSAAQTVPTPLMAAYRKSLLYTVALTRALGP